MLKPTEKRRKPPAWSGIATGRLPTGSTRSKYVSARAVGSFVPSLTRKAFETYGFSTATLLMDWERIAGREIALATSPERLKWPQGFETTVDDASEPSSRGRPGATLVLRVDPARALDIEYKSRQILERINSYFGYRAIAELRLLQAPVAAIRPRPDAVAADRSHPSVRNVTPHANTAPGTYGDEPLGQALARLEAGVKGRARRGE